MHAGNDQVSTVPESWLGKVTDGAAVLDLCKPDEMCKLADTLDCVRLCDMGLGRSTDVMLSESALLKWFCENIEDMECERLWDVSGDGENVLGAHERFLTEVDFESWEGVHKVVEYTEGWHSRFILINCLVRREGASSSLLIPPLESRHTSFDEHTGTYLSLQPKPVVRPIPAPSSP